MECTTLYSRSAGYGARASLRFGGEQRFEARISLLAKMTHSQTFAIRRVIH